MAKGNPTLAAANESTGLEPLNATPHDPVPPNEPSSNEPPPPLTSLPTGFQSINLPLDLGSRTKSSLSVSSLPSANEFEDLIRAKTRPPGPVRAEELDVEIAKQELGSDLGEVIQKIRSAVEEQDVKIYKVATGVGKGEYYVVGLDRDGERIIGAKYNVGGEGA